MKRIISKVDYDLYMLYQANPKKALEMWYKICENSTIINSAVEVVIDELGEQSFFAPAICHMILSYPWDIDKNIYDNLVLRILQNDELKKLSVFENKTFLNLIILNGALGFDSWYLKLASEGIHNKALQSSFEQRCVKYSEMLNEGEKLIRYQSDGIDVSLSESEMDIFSQTTSYDIEKVFSLVEVANLMDIVALFPTLDERIARSIQELYQCALNYQIIKDADGSPKL